MSDTISHRLWAAGYGHRPSRSAGGAVGLHDIFSFNTLEVVAQARAHEALAAVNLPVSSQETRT